MEIIIKELRIRNYKCFENVDIDLKESTLLLGANNVGKTSLLEALELCFTPYKRIGEELIFVKEDEILERSKEIILDVLISPEGDTFNEKWHQFFGNFVVEGDKEDFVALRTIIKYNAAKGEYDLERKALNAWPESEEVASFSNFNTSSVRREIVESIPVFYLDAKRDIVSEMNDKFSYWGKLVKDIKLTEKDLEEVEKHLNDINTQIIDSSSILKHLTSNLNKITEVINSDRSSVEINPVFRKIKDLDKGMEIKFKDKDSESFSIANQGMGTRSWATFLTLSAYIDWKVTEMADEEKPYHPLLLLEEPEAHLHPQAQRKIYNQMSKLTGQKIISTHSSIIAAQVELEEIIHVYKKGESSNLNYINLNDLSTAEIRQIKEKVIKTRGDILFADTLILCEGETEDQVLPEFFKEYFESEPFEIGTNIISVGGSGKYKPFMRVAKALDIDLFILSDGEERTIREVEKQFRQVYSDATNQDIENHIKFLPNGSDFEDYLVKENYEVELVKVIDSIKGKESFIVDFIEKNNGGNGKSKPTEKKCNECKQNIYEREIKDYAGREGYEKAIIDCLSGIKTDYSSKIGSLILEREDIDKIPLVIRDLFFEIAVIKKYSVSKQFAKVSEEGKYVKVNKDTTKDS
ncbi:ATP-dependent nuclease [Carnobacterium mobile]|uniref:ATP-dependent nuclease n=1 Tax=Carnobacterium mobile TaxID=2750 RepID=UPI0018661EA4|nr:AAA family ATPase [Carnobacterium mobile]